MASLVYTNVSLALMVREYYIVMIIFTTINVLMSYSLKTGVTDRRAQYVGKALDKFAIEHMHSNSLDNFLL